MTITYLTVRGTGEPVWGVNNMLNVVARMVNGPIEHVDVDYPASIAVFNPYGKVDGPSEMESRRQGVAALAKAIRATPHLVVLSGYSLGALVVSDFLTAQVRGMYSDCEIAGVVNIANPSRKAGQSYGLPSFGWGLDGQHGRWPDVPVYEIANPVDGITSAPANSPWRPLADSIRTFSVTQRGAVEWFNSMMARLDGQERRQAQAQWWDASFWQAYAEAPAWLRGYLFDGQHTTAYRQPRWIDSRGARVTGQQLAAQVVGRLAA